MKLGDSGPGIRHFYSSGPEIYTLVISWTMLNKKVKAFHTCYRALGPELIAMYWQSARR